MEKASLKRSYRNSGSVQYNTKNRGQPYQVYGINSRYHPQTFHNIPHNLKPEGSQQVEFHTQNFHNIPQELASEGDTQQIEYAYQGGESHEGEVINMSEDQDAHYQSPETDYQVNNYQPQESYSLPSHPGYYGYHYRPPIPPTPHPLLPHKSKQQSAPYTYYYIGRHLWYIPLYFSIYFIVYVGLLVLKSIARHKVLFPENLQAAAAASTMRDLHVLRSIDQAQKRYLMK
ncbi:uncharacterized protein LOC106668509 [Cimex lectularius]|uniref:Uncharacterized protein n=1 Tax=Cimex lectularius TaxID=79782 RepID=A0A8I6RWW3_CIMLE|nr:uncharacterized protein LOC106668509 [Cimex lectularius]